MYQFEENGQLTMLDMNTHNKSEKAPKVRGSKPDSALIAVPYFHLNLSIPWFSNRSTSSMTMG